MRLRRWSVVVLLIYFLIFFSHALFLQKTVYGDGFFYYSWVRSIVVDRDINFANEYSHFKVTAPITQNSRPGNKHPIGTPLFWLPWFLQSYSFLGGTGYELAYQLLAGSISVLAAVSGLILLYRLLMQSFSQTASTLAVISIAGATNFLFYGAVDPVNSHAISFFAVTVFLSFLFCKNVSPFLTGCALGFCALVRPQDAILGFLALPVYRKSSFARHRLAKLILGSIVAFSPQLIFWYRLYGSPWISPYFTSGESFAWWSPHFFDVLLSPTNGLFLWTPMTFLAIAGFIFWIDTRRVWFFTLFVAATAVVGSWSIWWQGASYSGRMLVSTLPVLAFGLTALYTKLSSVGLRWKSILVAIIGPLAIINILLIIRFLLQV